MYIALKANNPNHRIKQISTFFSFFFSKHQINKLDTKITSFFATEFSLLLINKLNISPTLRFGSFLTNKKQFFYRLQFVFSAF